MKFGNESFQKMNNTNYLKSTTVIKAQIDEDFSLENVGIIALAKLHHSPNRPIHKKKEITKETVFCYYCNLPSKTNGIIEPFHYCED